LGAPAGVSSRPGPSARDDQQGNQLMPFSPDAKIGDVLDSAPGRAILLEALPAVATLPFPIQIRHATVRQMLPLSGSLRDDEAAQADLFAALADVADSPQPEPAPEPEAQPTAAYEADDVPLASAELRAPASASRWGIFETEMRGPSHGNPYVDVELWGELSNGERTVGVPGFYDGDGVYRIRFMPETEGSWRLRTTSNARSLDGLSTEFTCTPAASGAHGPVRVHDSFHFRHADGARYLPIGTTLYAWTQQGNALEEQTLRTLASSPFNKVRMCVFPKSFDYNHAEPELFPFAGSLDAGWDFTRPNPKFWWHLEQRIADLAALGIEADLILFHPYDHWGFSDMGPAADDRYVRYAVARLAAFANVWWALANEYDLLWAKDAEDWDRFAGVIAEHDPYDHLISNHNCVELFDHSRPWVTHASLQRGDTEQAAQWRRQWGKPVVIDECGYEGDLEWGWGNLTAEELVRRVWTGVIHGGYVTHGETYHNDDELLWWSKGGTLHGDSPARIAFLREILDDAPETLEPLPSEPDAPWAGVPGSYYLAYLGISRPRRRTFRLPAGATYEVDVIDTWNMTTETLDGEHDGTVVVDLPARPYMAVRLRRPEPTETP
jgi:hypothetical protein